MSTEELLSMLEMPTDSTQSDLNVECIPARDTVSLSPTALKLDDWSLRRGREIVAENTQLQSLYGLTGKGKKVCEEADLATADFHAAAFEPDPELAKDCKNKRIHQYMKNLMDTPEFKALHQETQLDDVASEIATMAFSKEWVTLSKQEESPDAFKSEMQAMGAASRALTKASTEVSDLRDMQSAMGIGGDGGGQNKLAADQLTAMFKRVRGSHQLKRICELAGRYRRFAQAQQRKKVLHGLDDVVGVVLDGDIGRLLPSELVQLDDPDLELDAMRRIIERQAMCREYRGIEAKARGPIVVVVDESGSMSGEPICTAKAIALAMAWVARHQKRYCCLVGFSGGTEGTWCVIPPGKDDPTSLMEWLEHFFSGGTTCDVPLAVLPSKWDSLGCPKGKTDIVIITDAQVDVPDELTQSFLAWKQRESVKLISLIIGAEPGDLRAVSDRVHIVQSLSMEEEGVGEILGI